MKKSDKKIIKLAALEILRLIDSSLAGYGLAFTRGRKQRFELHEYLEENSIERSSFLRKISVLKRRGLIARFSEGKNNYVELTAKGREKIKELEFDRLCIERPNKWDGKWRVIIFDIPEKEKILRNSIRRKLYQIGFLQVQKSVFIYPFECTDEINLICDRLGGREYLKFFIADIVEGEVDIIEQFMNRGILGKSDING